MNGTGFYSALPAAARELNANGVLTLQELRDLFGTFATEFMETFSL